MMRRVIVAAVLCGLVGTVPCSAEGLGASVAGKVWRSTLSLSTSGIDLESDATLMLGGTLSLDLGDVFWVTAQYLQGDFEFSLPGGTLSMNEKDAEVVVGMSFDVFDVGVGARYVTMGSDDIGSEDSVFGPMVYVGVGSVIGDSPVGFYVGASLVPMTSDEDAYLEHYNVEGGLFASLPPLVMQVGYRYKNFYNVEGVDVYQAGAVAAVGITL